MTSKNRFSQLFLFLFVSVLFASCGSTSGTTGSTSGTNNREIKGSVTGNGYKDHSISFNTNQVLKLNLDAGNSTCYFNLITPQGETIFNGANEGKSFSGTMSFTGSYTVRVYLMGDDKSSNRTVNYRIYYSLQ